MRVNKELRKKATLLMLDDRKQMFECGVLAEDCITSYYLANWHGIPQPNAWHILEELCLSRLITRYSNPANDNVIEYRLNKRGQKYVEKHFQECLTARDEVWQWKIHKYKRGLSK